MTRQKKIKVTLVTAALSDQQVETLDRMVALRRRESPTDFKYDRAAAIAHLLNFIRWPERYVSPIKFASSVSDLNFKPGGGK